MKELRWHDYLEQERAIPRAVLLSPRFKGCIRVDARANAIFPHFDEKGLCGFEKRNRGFKGFADLGEKGLWMSFDNTGTIWLTGSSPIAQFPLPAGTTPLGPVYIALQAVVSAVPHGSRPTPDFLAACLTANAQRLQRNESRPLARPLHGVRTALQPKFLGTRLDRHSSHIGRAAGDPDRNRTSSPVKALTEVFGWMWLVPVPRGQEAEKAKTVNGTGKNYLRTEAY